MRPDLDINTLHSRGLGLATNSRPPISVESNYSSATNIHGQTRSPGGPMEKWRVSPPTGQPKPEMAHLPQTWTGSAGQKFDRRNSPARRSWRAVLTAEPGERRRFPVPDRPARSIVLGAQRCRPGGLAVPANGGHSMIPRAGSAEKKGAITSIVRYAGGPVWRARPGKPLPFYSTVTAPAPTFTR